MSSAEPLDGLTRRQRKILDVIRGRTLASGHAPSMREVRADVDLRSLGGLAYQYRELIAKGYLRREQGRSRTGGSADVVLVPIAGRIAAGGPITAQQEIEGYLPMPREIVGRLGSRKGR